MFARQEVIAAAGAALVMTGIMLLPPVDRLRGLSLDLLFWLRAHSVETPAPAAAPVAVIALDEETYRTQPFRDVPNALWSRDLAKLLDALVAADAAVVGFDVIFPTSVERYVPGFDRDFLVALRHAAQADKVVLGKVQHQQKPIAPFAAQQIAVRAERNLRSVNLFTDPDDVVRRVPLMLQRDGGGSEPGFALELAARKLGVVPAADAGGWRLGDWRIPGSAQNRLTVNFHRDLGIPTYSLADLAACVAAGRTDYIRRQFAGRVVLIGTVLDVEDRKVTSMRWITGPEGPANAERCALPPTQGLFHADVVRDSIPGVFVHATAVRNLLDRSALREPPGWTLSLFDFAFALAAACLVLLFRPLTALAVLAAAVLLWCAVAVGALGHFLVLPIAVPALAALLSFGAMLGWRFAVSDRDKRFLRDSFSLYLAPALVDRLIAGKTPPALGGETREITVFFSDLAGFSSLSEGLAPDAVVRLMNVYLGAMTEEIERHGGIVDKYIGDAIVALFGAPLADADHAAHAVAAALACQQRLAAMTATDPVLAGQPLRQRIGLNTGPAVVGNIGSQRRFNYTAMGDVVNLAARLEGANKAYGTDIMASETTRQAAGAGFLWRELDAVRVVGREQPVTIWQPLGAAGDAALQQISAGYMAALRAWREGDLDRCIAQLDPLAANDAPAARLRQRAQELRAAGGQPAAVRDLQEK